MYYNDFKGFIHDLLGLAGQVWTLGSPVTVQLAVCNR